MTVNDIYDLIDRIAPFDTQLPFDNAGLLISDGNKKVTKIGVCLDKIEHLCYNIATIKC